MRSGSDLAWLAGVALLALPACAHVEAPPGGPEDKTGPRLVVSRPDSSAVIPSWRGSVVLAFDERISERGIDRAVEVSPRTSAPVVSHGGDELRVRLREGWQPGTVYHVTVMPEVRDLFGNSLEAPIRLVFSTGPEIPQTRIAGQALDRTTASALRGLRVEAIRAADSLVYTASTDTAGRFAISNLPTGEYLLRAFEDMNRNRALDPFEPRDAATVTVEQGDSANSVLSVVLPDSTPPRIATARVSDRVIEMELDDYLDPAQVLPPARVVIRDDAGGVVPVSRVAIGRLTEEGDTATADPLPSRRVLVELPEDVQLAPGATYSITVLDIRNIVGLQGDPETTITIPPAGESADPGAGRPLPNDNPNSNRS